MPTHSLPSSIAGFCPGDLRWDQVEGGHSRHAAVCLLFVPGQGNAAHIILTKRSTNVRTHKGQVGFAGGRAELGDGTIFQTALREVDEEIGLSIERVTPHGYLPPLPSLGARSLIYPVIGTADIRVSELTPDPNEVAQIYDYPWTEFIFDNSRPFKFNLFGNWRTSHHFDLPDCTVWGLTAAMLCAANLK